MIDESSAVLPLWMLLSATFGFMIGEAFGGQAVFASISSRPMRISASNSRGHNPAHRPCNVPSISRSKVINDIHRRLVTVTKGLENLSSKPNQINGRNLPDPAVSKGMDCRTGKIREARTNRVLGGAVFEPRTVRFRKDPIPSTLQHLWDVF